MEDVLYVLGGMMMGTVIGLLLIVRSMIVMERRMEDFTRELVSRNRIAMGNDDDPFGEIAWSSKARLPPQGASASPETAQRLPP